MPVEWSMKLFNWDFWQAEVKKYYSPFTLKMRADLKANICRYAGSSLKIAPLKVGTEWTAKPDGSLYPLDRQAHFVEFEGLGPATAPATLSTNIAASLSMSPLEITAASASQARSARVGTIEAAAAQSVRRRAQVATQAQKVPAPAQHPDSDSDSDDDDERPYACPRYNEIRTYLLNNRRQLALHTMCFKMPEHTLVSLPK